jgi:hypothetical protein
LTGRYNESMIMKDGKVMRDSNFFTGNLNGVEIDGGL